MQTALILALFAALFAAWAWLSDKAGRFALGLYEAKCPHCQAVDTLDIVEQGIFGDSFLLPPMPEDNRGALLVCRRCQKECRFSDLTQAPEDPAPLPGAAA